MKRKLISATWFIMSLLLVMSEPQTNTGLIIYLPIIANLILSALYAKSTFKVSVS